MTALLIFERQARYRDRSMRYLVELDGCPQAPRLQGNHAIEVPVEPGEHLVRVSVRQRRFFEAPVTIDGGTRRLLIVPARCSMSLTGNPGWSMRRPGGPSKGRLAAGRARCCHPSRSTRRSRSVRRDE